MGLFEEGKLVQTNPSIILEKFWHTTRVVLAGRITTGSSGERSTVSMLGGCILVQNCDKLTL